jgi:heme exporter protein CcmD
MITQLISMNGYGLFVWLSFGITISACLIFYLKTRKILKKYETEFAAELIKLSQDEKKSALQKSKIANQVLASQNKTF